MAYYLKLYFSTLAVFFAIDMFWLGLVARTFYRKHLGFLMAPNPNWLAAIIFYLLFIVGILVFVVLPGLEIGVTPRYAVSRRTLWVDHLCHVRSYQSRHAQRLAHYYHSRGHDLGDSAKCNGQLRILRDWKMAHVAQQMNWGARPNKKQLLYKTSNGENHVKRYITPTCQCAFSCACAHRQHPCQHIAA